MDLLRLVLVATMVSSVVSARHLMGNTDKRALYFATNDPSGSSIVSIKIAEDGKLLTYKLTPTGGIGSLSLTPATNAPNSPLIVQGANTFFGQGAIEVVGNYLFVVNAGSNTLSLFVIDENDPSCLTLLGKPADTLGDFPVSVSYSSKLKTACVVNGGKVGGVTCFSVSSVTGLTLLDKSARSLYPALNQTTPPVGIAGTVSEITFNPSSTAVFILVKSGNTGPPGFIYTFPVVDGKVSREPQITTFETLPGSFSIEFINEDDSIAFISDASIGGAALHISPGPEFKITVQKYIVITYQSATCWTSYSPITNSVYYTDANSPNITVVDATTLSITATIDFPSPAPPGTNFTLVMNGDYGGYDSAVDRTHLYFLAGTAGVNVVDILTKTVVQQFNLSALGDRDPWVGMATYPMIAP